jgi:fumarylacetoacetate (FAA) hydrolase
MKLISYQLNNTISYGVLVNNELYSLPDINASFPDSMNAFLALEETGMEMARQTAKQIEAGTLVATPVSNYEILAPVPHPTSCRDGYAFRQHVEAARKNRGVEMIPEFDQYPIFYFTNHQAVEGPGPVYCMPDHFQQLDFELEIAIVIGKKGRNIKASEADAYIAGFTIMNDMSARKLQMEEMILNLGPAKGKDFSTVIGPWLVTPDELAQKVAPTKTGHTGLNYDLAMKCYVNDILVSSGNVKDMDWTFAEIIERCSYGVTLYPGDVIGSGTVGTGCFLELNGTGKRLDPNNYQPQWLQNGDRVTMTIDALGILENQIIAEDTNWSILSLKK